MERNTTSMRALAENMSRSSTSGFTDAQTTFVQGVTNSYSYYNASIVERENVRVVFLKFSRAFGTEQ